MVLDADGLWLVTQQPALVTGNRRVVLTPNAVEFRRLAEAVGTPLGGDGLDLHDAVAALSAK